MMNTSSPLMTVAPDIIDIESMIGGMNSAADIIAELDESFKISTADYELLKTFPGPIKPIMFCLGEVLISCPTAVRHKSAAGTRCRI